MKFATRNLYSFQPNPDYVVTLTWEVKSPNLLKITKDTIVKIVQRQECTFLSDRTLLHGVNTCKQPYTSWTIFVEE